MTIESTIYNESNFIYIDSIRGYNPQIGDVVTFDRKTCQIGRRKQNICQVFGLTKDDQGRPIEDPEKKNETMLGTACYRSEGACKYDISLSGEATIPGHLSSISGENGIKFTSDEQFVFKFVESKTIVYGTYSDKEIKGEIRRNINNYETGCYALIYGLLKCERADLYEGNKGDCVFNAASNAEVLKGWKVRTTCTFSGKKKASLDVTQRPNATVGAYIIRFKVGSKKDILRRPQDPEIKLYERGIQKKSYAESDEIITEDNDSSNIEFFQEEFDRASKYF